MELDHVYVFTTVGAPEARVLVEAGLTEGSGNVHPGQGTSNRRFFLHNFMLELIWLRDEAEARSAVVAPTLLWERSRHQACPMGICLRGARTELPFPTWEYRPPYLPAGRAIHVAHTPPEEPLLFLVDGLVRPDEYPEARREPLEHAAGLRELTSLRLTMPTTPSVPLRALESLELVRLHHGVATRMELQFDDGKRGWTRELHPLPWTLSA
ncbi:MAG: glyoxalase-like domain protein [Myxococcota bacterium]